MSDYAQRFAENDIDESVFPDLTERRLKDLGVSLAYCLKMLRAIAKVADAYQPTAELVVATSPLDGAERRQLTVMFCDLAGSVR